MWVLFTFLLVTVLFSVDGEPELVGSTLVGALLARNRQKGHNCKTKRLKQTGKLGRFQKGEGQIRPKV
jgi:hypothetical protein